MVIPPSINEVFSELKEEVIWAHGRWLIYRQLFLHSDKRIDLLNEVAAAFFYMIQNLLQEEVQITLSKLTDPARSGKNENLSLVQLQERIEEVGNRDLSARLRVLLDRLTAECSSCRAWRNKQLAHLDLKAALKILPDPLPAVTVEQIESALGIVREYLNELEYFYTERQTGYDQFIMHSDGQALIAILKLGLRYDDLRKSGQISWDDSRESPWCEG